MVVDISPFIRVVLFFRGFKERRADHHLEKILTLMTEPGHIKAVRYQRVVRFAEPHAVQIIVGKAVDAAELEYNPLILSMRRKVGVDCVAPFVVLVFPQKLDVVPE